MKDYEIFDSEEKLGNVDVFWDNININSKDSIIKSFKDIKYKSINLDNNVQYYILSKKISSIDDIYDIVSKYTFNEKEIFDKIEEIKINNNIKKLKETRIIDIVIPEMFLKYFDLDKKDVDLKSLIQSKIYFIKNVSLKNEDDSLMKKLELVVNSFNKKIISDEFSFYTDEEKNMLLNNILRELEDLISYCEINTKYKYGKDFLTKLRIKSY